MRNRYDSALTMFVHLKGHSVLEYYFGLRDARSAANDRHPPSGPRVVTLLPQTAARDSAHVPERSARQ